MSTPNPTAPNPPPAAHPHYSRGLLLLLATIAGVSVANIYYNQPLLGALRESFPHEAGWIGVVPTATQLGYAAGMLLLAPLGDRFDRRRLILLQIAGLCAALLIAAAAPALPVLAAASLAIGVLSTIAQQAVPFAAGFIAEYFGWRAVFCASVASLVAIAAAVLLRLPRSTPTSTLSYPQLIGSLWHLAVELRGLRHASATGAALFAAFSAFWPALTLLLAGTPFHFGPQVAGLFGIVGAAGALAAPYAGKSADRRGPRAVISLSIGLVALSFVIFAVSATHLIGLALGVIVLDVGVQAAQISNQSRIYALKPEARSRVNTVYMVCYFIGGAIGSSAGVAAWHAAGWTGVSAVGLLFAALAGWIHHRSGRHRD